jgi:hypothetical protein
MASRRDVRSHRWIAASIVLCLVAGSVQGAMPRALGAVDRPRTPTVALGSHSARTWRIVSHFARADDVQIVDVSCYASNACLAVADSQHGQLVISFSTHGVQDTSHAYVPFGSLGGVLSCPSATMCVADATKGEAQRVEDTTDGGRRWTVQHLPSSFQADSASCPTTLECMLVGSHGTQSAYARAVTTTDGGAHWHLVGRLPPAYGSQSDVRCPSITVCYAASTLGTPSYVDVTDDFGVSWRLTALRSSRELLGQLSCSSVDSCAVDTAASTTRGFVELSATWLSDGGKGLRRGSRLRFEGIATGFACSTSVVCELSGQFATNLPPVSFMVQTLNGGATWHRQVLPGGLLTVFDVWCSSPTSCVAAGDIGYAAGDVLLGLS